MGHNVGVIDNVRLSCHYNEGYKWDITFSIRKAIVSGLDFFFFSNFFEKLLT